MNMNIKLADLYNEYYKKLNFNNKNVQTEMLNNKLWNKLDNKTWESVNTIDLPLKIYLSTLQNSEVFLDKS